MLLSAHADGFGSRGDGLAWRIAERIAVAVASRQVCGVLLLRAGREDSEEVVSLRARAHDLTVGGVHDEPLVELRAAVNAQQRVRIRGVLNHETGQKNTKNFVWRLQIGAAKRFQRGQERGVEKVAQPRFCAKFLWLGSKLMTTEGPRVRRATGGLEVIPNGRRPTGLRLVAAALWSNPSAQLSRIRNHRAHTRARSRQDNECNQWWSKDQVQDFP